VLATPLRKLNNGSGKRTVGIVDQAQAGKSPSVPGGRERVIPRTGDGDRASGAEPHVVLIIRRQSLGQGKRRSLKQN
jgi:hypothetical protein